MRTTEGIVVAERFSVPVPGVFYSGQYISVLNTQAPFVVRTQ